MNVAVTGAGGLLGRAVIEKLLVSGHKVRAFSGSLGQSELFEVVPWNASQEPENMARHLQGIDVVVHSGARIPNNHLNADEASYCFEVNALGTLKLLQACQRAGVRRFIFVSSANTLKPVDGMIRVDSPVGCEHAPFYLGSKVLGEIYCRSAMQRGLEVLIFRPSSIYGPGVISGVIFLFAEKMKAGLPVEVNNAGRFSADFVWRDDVACALCHAVESQYQGAVNIGSGVANSVLEIAEMLADVLRADRSLIRVEPATAAFDEGFAAVDNRLAIDWFNFRPLTLQQGLKIWFNEEGNV